MLRAFYDWTIGLADHPRALWALAIIAFIESSFFPIPPDALLIPMILTNPRKAWLYAGVAMLASVLGGLLGYTIGASAFEQIGQPVLAALGKTQAAMEYSERFNAFGFWTVLTAGITPLPFKVIAIMSGATAMPIGLFLITAFMARSIRFFAVAALLWFFGDRIRHFIEMYLGWVFLLFILMLISGVIGVRYL
jgi:membrane protein YqaA with SNARE-associated domain